MNAKGHFRWVICALLFFACVVNYMDRQVLGLLKPDLSRTFHWSEADYACGMTAGRTRWFCVPTAKRQSSWKALPMPAILLAVAAR